MNSGQKTGGPEEIENPAMQFDEIAFLYDELMIGVPYRGWVGYLHKILDSLRYRPSSILDLCCGTGVVSLLLAQQGYEVVGIDISPKMIESARNSAAQQFLPVEFDVQDAAKLRLGRKFDLVVSFFDSLNYITSAADLQQTFHRVSEHMEPGAYFIFDMNTELALAAGMFTQNNLGTRSAVIYDWRSTYDPESRICRVRMDFTCNRGGEKKKVRVTHVQRAYDEEEIVEMLRTAGLETVAVYDAYSLRQATRKSDRAFFIARK